MYAMRFAVLTTVYLLTTSCVAGFGINSSPRNLAISARTTLSASLQQGEPNESGSLLKQGLKTHQSLFIVSVEATLKDIARTALAIALVATLAAPAFAVEDSGASSAANAKLTTGGASTLQSGRTISITRGVNLDRSDFHGQNLKGVAFQQSVVRDADFSNTNLVGASFFDATLDGSNFENADMTMSNVEMAQFNRASLKNAVLKEVYVSGATLFTGVKDIEGSDWTDTYLRADQKKYLCSHPTAKGTNPKTGADTRESLMCVD
jgi:uncharacterized protein YjbI with pentapeptide repeats